MRTIALISLFLTFFGGSTWAQVSKEPAFAISAVHPDGEKILRGDSFPDPAYRAVAVTSQQTGADSERVLVAKKPLVTNADIKSASLDEKDPSQIKITLTAEAASRFGDFTQHNEGRRIAIVVDGSRVVTAPVLKGPIYGGKITFPAGKSRAEAEALLHRLK